MTNLIQIYYISLEVDIQRRIHLSSQFPQYYKMMNWIPAVNGQTLSISFYFKSITDYYTRHARLLSPGEVATSLSHIEALKNFLSSNSTHALILEDDIKGCDKDLEEINKLIPLLSENEILICGGQTSAVNRKYQLGKKTLIPNTVKLSQFSYSHIYGACCYVVNKKIAKNIIEKQARYLKIADNWDIFFKNSNIEILYTNILHHPDDRTNSHLQTEREAVLKVKQMNFLERIISGHFFVKNFNLLKNHLTIFYLLLIGYRKIR